MEFSENVAHGSDTRVSFNRPTASVLVFMHRSELEQTKWCFPLPKSLLDKEDSSRGCQLYQWRDHNKERDGQKQPRHGNQNIEPPDARSVQPGTTVIPISGSVRQRLFVTAYTFFGHV